MLAYFLLGSLSRLHQAGEWLWSSLHGARFDTPWTQPDARSGDEHQQGMDAGAVVGVSSALPPQQPNLHAVLEAELAWDLVGEQARTGPSAGGSGCRRAGRPTTPCGPSRASCSEDVHAVEAVAMLPDIQLHVPASAQQRCHLAFGGLFGVEEGGDQGDLAARGLEFAHLQRRGDLIGDPDWPIALPASRLGQGDQVDRTRPASRPGRSRCFADRAPNCSKTPLTPPSISVQSRK